LKEQIARFEGVSAVGASHGMWGYYRSPDNRAYAFVVDEGMRFGWSELPLSSAQWDRLFANSSGVFVSRKAAGRFNLKEGDPFPLVTDVSVSCRDCGRWASAERSSLPSSAAYFRRCGQRGFQSQRRCGHYE